MIALGRAMNQSLNGLDGRTHLKIVTVAAVLAALFFGVAESARMARFSPSPFEVSPSEASPHPPFPAVMLGHADPDRPSAPSEAPGTESA